LWERCTNEEGQHRAGDGLGGSAEQNRSVKPTIHSPGILVHDHCHAPQIQPVTLRRETLAKPVRDVVRAQQGRDDDEDLGRNEGERDGVPRFEDGALELEVAVLASGGDGAGVAQRGNGGFDVWGEVAAAAQLWLDQRGLEQESAMRCKRVTTVEDNEQNVLICARGTAGEIIARPDVVVQRHGAEIGLGWKWRSVMWRRIGAWTVQVHVPVPVTTHGILDAQTPVRPELPTPLRVDLPFEVERPLLVCHVPGRDDECETDPEEQGVDGKEGAVVE
jgi:hypothetical protein